MTVGQQVRIFQPRDAFLLVDCPVCARRLSRLALQERLRVARVGREGSAGERGLPVRLDLLEDDDEHVPGLRSFDVERTDLRVGSDRRDLFAVLIISAGIDRLGDHAVTGLDTQRRRMRE